MKRAREAAEAAAETAQHAAEAARTRATEVGRTASDPAMHERLRGQAREAVGQARRGITTVVERIDPGTLAELIIKATALQEKANGHLRAKGSAYRVAEITITASLPPQVGFSISRIGDPEAEEPMQAVVESTALLEEVPAAEEELISLAGETAETEGSITAEVED